VAAILSQALAREYNAAGLPVTTVALAPQLLGLTQTPCAAQAMAA
jgi:hypothetical protein